MADRLTKSFTIELLAYALSNDSVMSVCINYLKFSYLQNEKEKGVWKFISNFYKKRGVIPSYGQITQEFSNDEDSITLVYEISEVKVKDDSESVQNILSTFETFIRRMIFIDANDKMVNAYNLGKVEESYSMFTKYAEEFNAFTILDAQFETVFGDFKKRQVNRVSLDYKKRRKIPTTIDELDYKLGGDSGGPETGEYCLWLAESGGGKSKLLVYLGVAAARQGEIVVHFQLEGTREQCLNNYDACWTGTLYQEVKQGKFSDIKMKSLSRIINRLKNKDIFVISEETFNAKTIPQMRADCKAIEKKYGKIGVICVDYLELAELGDGISYGPRDERFRQAKLSKAMKQIAMEFNCVVHAATQSNDVDIESKNDPNFVRSRNNLSEDRGKLKPADLFITLNQTVDEEQQEVMRLYGDKFRDYKKSTPFYICNNFAYSRFYDRKRTLAFNDEIDE